MTVDNSIRQIPFAMPIIGDQEKAAVNDVLSGPILVHGPKCSEFENAFSGYISSPDSVAVSSCTAALHLAYFNRKLVPGDEVIVPAMTHTATAHAVEYCGAKPVFVDAEEDTGNINIDLIEGAITGSTRAISVVHYLGIPVDMDRINSIARKYGLYVIEDCALAIGTYYRGIHAGLLGDAGCFSFYPVKHITTAEGGMFVSRHKEISEEVRLQRAFGVDRHMGQRKVPGQYDAVMLGFNYRLNELQCAIGIEQLKRVDGFLSKRRENFDELYKELGSVDEVKILRSYGDAFQSSCYCLGAVLKGSVSDKRTEIIVRLKEMGIGTSVYYPGPVPLYSYYRDKYGYKAGDFTVAEEISSSSIALPVGPHLCPDDMVYISQMLKDVISEVK